MKLILYGKHSVKEAMKYGNIIQLIENKVQVDKILGKNINHQNIAAIIDYKLYSIDAFMNDTHVLMLDGITDIGNLGSIIRSAASLKWNSIVLSKKLKASLNGAVAKIASGALHHVKIAIDNVYSAIAQFKKNKFQIIGLDENGSNDIVISNKKLLIIGDEHNGIQCDKQCDMIYSIEKIGFSTLNASVAAGIAMYNLR